MEIKCFFGKTLVDITKFVNENGLLPYQILGLQFYKNDSVVIFYFVNLIIKVEDEKT